MSAANKQFNKLLEDLGFFVQLDYTNHGIKAYYFNEDSQPISLGKIEERFEQYCKNLSLPKQEFKLTANLPTYKFKKGVLCN